MSKKAQQTTAKFKTKTNPEKKKKRGFKMWSAFSILLLIIAVLILLSWILQWSGVTTEVTNDQFFQNISGSWEQLESLPSDSPAYLVVSNTWWNNNQSSLDSNTIYLVRNFVHESRIQALGILDIFVAPAKGFLDKAGVIVFIMTLGAFIFIIVKSKSLEGFSQAIVRKMKGKEIWAIIPLMLFFSLAGTTIGMAEETLGFYAVIVPLMLAAGFDTMTGLLVIFLGAGTGVLTSTVNPFMISVALDGLNEGGTIGGNPITAGDGIAWRLVSWVIMTALAIGFVMWYANRVKKDPKKSVTFATSQGDKTFFLANSNDKIKMDWRKKTTLAIFAIVFLFMIIYLIDWDSITGTKVMEQMGDAIHNNFPYFNYTIPGFGKGDLEFIASFFILGAIVVGMVNYIGVKKPVGKTSEDFIISDIMSGANDILSVCLIIATASGIGFVLVQSHMQELFVHALANSIGGINSGIGKIIVLFILFLPLSFLIPSSSGFATAVFPLLTGVVSIPNGATGTVFDPVTASGSITAFSFASGLINLITPTSGVVMGSLAITRIDYGKFLKFMLPFVGIMFLASIVLLAIGGAIGGNIA